MSQLLIFLNFSMLLTMVSSNYSPCVSPCIDRASPSELAQMSLRLYKTNLTDYYEASMDNTDEIFNKMDITKPNSLFIHGYLECMNLRLWEPLIEALIARNYSNVLFLNWRNLSCTFYTSAAKNCNGIGWRIAQIFNQWSAAGQNTSDTELLGHSLGAHIAGFIGKYSNDDVSKIIAMDPAGPGFNNAPAEYRLNSTDSKFTISYYSDMYVFGTRLTLGHLNVYINGGTNIQPGCLIGLDLCSHVYVIKMVTASIINPNLFWARVCNSWFSFVFGLCDSNEMILAGYDASITSRGRVYLRTTASSPYGCGKSCASSSSLY